MDSDQQPRDDGERIRRFVALAGILVALGGQSATYAITLPEDFAFPSSLAFTIAGVTILIASRFIRVGPGFQSLSRRLPSGTLAWILGAVVLSGLAVFSTVLFESTGRLNYYPVLVFWLAAGLSFILAFAGRINLHGWKPWLKEHWVELSVLAAITLVAGYLRFHNLGVSPRIIDGDEGRIGIAAQSTTTSRLSNPFALWENFGALYLQAMNAAMLLAGVDPFGLRLLPAIGGTLAIPSVYLFARQVGGRRVALIAAVLLATMHTHMHFSRIASVAYIQGTLLGPLELWLLLSGLQKRSTWRAAAGGVLLAVHFCVYLTAQVLLALVLIYFVVCYLFLRSWFRPALKQAAAFVGGFVIMVLPWLVVALQYPGEMANRLNQNGTFQSGWLSTTMASTGQSTLQLLGGRVLHAFLSLIYYPPFDFYGSPVPTLALISAVLFLLGIGLALLRIREPGVLLLNGYFWSTTLAIGLFAVPPSADTYRMLMALPAAVVLAGIGLDTGLEYLGLGFTRSRSGYALTAGVVLGSLLIFNVWTYYGDFLGQCRFGGNLSDRFASYLGDFVHGVGNQSRIYLLSNDVFRYGTHASVDFLSKKRPIINHDEPVDTLDIVLGETVIASPDRVQELEAWVREHPGGELQYVRDCTTTILLAYQYP